MKTLVPLLLSALVLTTACTRAHFVQTDSRFSKAWTPKRPQIYIDRLPERPYRSVGIIEVPAVSLETVLKAVGDEGQISGCDVIVDRSIHQVRKESGMKAMSSLRMRAQHGQPFIPRPAQPHHIYSAPSPGNREFICGAWEEA